MPGNTDQDPWREVRTLRLQAGQVVYLPDVKSWHKLRVIENHGVDGIYAWFGESSHAVILREPKYMVRVQP